MSLQGPWSLRCGLQFLDEVTEALYAGGAWVRADAAMPEGFVAALEDRLHQERWQLARVEAPCSGRLPLACVAESVEVSPTRLALATPRLAQHVAVIDLAGCAPARMEAWQDFAGAFAETRAREATGLSLLILAGTEAPPLLRAPAWEGRIRRADCGLWADIHASGDRPEPLGQLIHATAVELLGWRLDLVPSFMQVDGPDALDPLGWLQRRPEPGAGVVRDFGGRAFACPLDLSRRGEVAPLQNRLWRAQLAAVFPWIEEQRQQVLERFSELLDIGDLHREKFRISSVAELEISEIARQLREKDAVPREIQGAYDALGAIRKALAHRQPAHRRHLQAAFDALGG